MDISKDIDQSQFRPVRVVRPPFVSTSNGSRPSGLSCDGNMDGLLVNGIAFHDALRAILRNPQFTHRDKSVASYLIDRASSDGLVWASCSTIGGATGVKRNKVVGVLARLTRLGFISVDTPATRTKPAIYKIACSPSTGLEVVPPRDYGSPAKGLEVVPPRDTTVLYTDLDTVSNVNTDSKKNNKGILPFVSAPSDVTDRDPLQPRTPKKKPDMDPVLAIEIPPDLNTTAFCEMWTEWVLERKARNKKLTVRAAKMQLLEFEVWGPNKSILAIETSIRKGWTGIFEPKAGDEFVPNDNAPPERWCAQ